MIAMEKGRKTCIAWGFDGCCGKNSQGHQNTNKIQAVIKDEKEIFKGENNLNKILDTAD